MSAYEGKEEQLNAALRQQYGQDLTTTNTVKTDLRERLVSFYKVFNPAKISSADLDTVTNLFKDKEQQLNDALRRCASSNRLDYFADEFGSTSDNTVRTWRSCRRA